MTGRLESPACAAVLPLLPLHFYSGLETAERLRVESHLSACADCAAAWEETRRALAAVDSGDAFPREREVDWDEFARRTVARARAAGTATGASGAGPGGVRRGSPWVWPAGVAAAAASILVVAALRLITPPARPGPALPAPAAAGTDGEPAVATEAARYLEAGVARRAAARTLRDGRALLLDLLDAPVRCRREDGRYDIALERARSRDLLRRVAVQQRALEAPEDQRLAEMLGALSDLLLGVAELDDCADGAQMRALREAIERRQVLLRIDLMSREAEGRRA
jgi:hypothetical protein